MKHTVIGLILILMIASNLHSKEIPYGQEFQANTYTDGYQSGPAIVSLKNGDFVLCWSSDEQDGYWSGVFGQLFNKFCIKKGDEFQINTYTTYHQQNPSVTTFTENKFVVCWASYQQDGSEDGIFGQLFDEVGNKIGNEFQINTYTQDNQSLPKISGLTDGEFAVCWIDAKRDGSSYGIFGQIFNTEGSKKGDEFQVNTTTMFTQFNPSIASLSNGGFIVSWFSSFQDGSGDGVYAQLFDHSGNKIGHEFQVNSYTLSDQNNPAVAVLKDGKIVICWVSFGQGGNKGDILGQIFDETGVKIGREFQVNTHTNNHQDKPALTSLYFGGFIVCWESLNQDGSDYGVFGQVFDKDGYKLGKEFQINSYTSKDQYNAAVATLQDSSFIVCWESSEQDGSSYGIFAKHFSAPINHNLNKFSLWQPINDATLNTTRPTFCWQQPDNIIEYYSWELVFNLYIDTTPNFANPQIFINIEDTTYTTDSLEPGKTYFWKVLAKNLAGDSLWSTQQDWGFFISHNATSVETADENVPQQFELFQNHPDPFNSSTEIKYSLPQDRLSYYVTMKIYDIRGRLVNTLVDQYQTAGAYSIRWNGRDKNGQVVSSGIYFYTLQADKFKTTYKMLLIQ